MEVSTLLVIVVVVWEVAGSQANVTEVDGNIMQSIDANIAAENLMALRLLNLN